MINSPFLVSAENAFSNAAFMYLEVKNCGVSSSKYVANLSNEELTLCKKSHVPTKEYRFEPFLLQCKRILLQRILICLAKAEFNNKCQLIPIMKC